MPSTRAPARSWSATTARGALVWTAPGKLSGASALVQLVEEALALPEPVLVTPTGPSVARIIADPLAVLALVLAIAPGASFSSDIPDVSNGIPEGAES
jgi:hypothetical protein